MWYIITQRWLHAEVCTTVLSMHATNPWWSLERLWSRLAPMLLCLLCKCTYCVLSKLLLVKVCVCVCMFICDSWLHLLFITVPTILDSCSNLLVCFCLTSVFADNLVCWFPSCLPPVLKENLWWIVQWQWNFAEHIHACPSCHPVTIIDIEAKTKQ